MRVEIVKQALIQLESGWLLSWRLDHYWILEMSSQVGCYCSLENSQVDKAYGYFSPHVVYLASSHTWKHASRN